MTTGIIYHMIAAILNFQRDRGSRSRTEKVRKIMANRHTLHSNKLDAFRKWLIKTGWTIEETKGIWEVLRAKKAGRQNPLIVYQKMNKEHLIVLDRDIDVIKKFLQEK